MERCHFVVAQIICLLWYFQHFEEYLSISIFLNPLFPVLEVLLCVVYSAQQIKWTLIKRHTFVASSTVFKYLKKLTSTDNNFHFFCFSMPSLQGFLEYLFSSIRKISASAFSTCSSSIWAVHPVCTESVLFSLARASNITLIFGLQYFARVGHMWVVYSNIWNSHLYCFLIRYSLLLRLPGYVQFLTQKKFQSIVFFI